MTQYCKVYINPVTNEIEHLITSDAPSGIKGGISTNSVLIEKIIDIESYDTNQFKRGREILSELEVHPVTKNVKIKQGSTKIRVPNVTINSNR